MMKCVCNRIVGDYEIEKNKCLFCGSILCNEKIIVPEKLKLKYERKIKDLEHQIKRNEGDLRQLKLVMEQRKARLNLLKEIMVDLK